MLGCTSCSTPMEAVPNHTMRIGQPEIEPGKELDLHIFTNKAECLGAGVSPEEIPLCTPWMDRSTGQVRLGFQFRLESEPFPLPVWKEHVDVLHDGAKVLDGEGAMRVTRSAKAMDRVSDLAPGPASGVFDESLMA